MEKNKCYNDDLLACQKKLVILELCQADVYRWIRTQTHVYRYVRDVAAATAACARALGLGNTMTKTLLHSRKYDSRGWQQYFAEGW